MTEELIERLARTVYEKARTRLPPLGDLLGAFAPKSWEGLTAPQKAEWRSIVQDCVTALVTPSPPPAPTIDRSKMTGYRFDMIGAHQAGARRHPQTEILELFPGACDFEAFTIGDAWVFNATPRANTPIYIRPMGKLFVPTVAP